MRPLSMVGLLVITSFGLACTNQSAVGPSPIANADPASVSAATSDEGVASGTMAPKLILSATVRFGHPEAGSPFPPAIEHDQSIHAIDNLIPRTVVIDKGGTVTFEAVALHQIAIYAPGKDPGDVNVQSLAAIPCPGTLPPRINDPIGRIPINGSNPTGCGPRTYTHTFANPGRYLVICEVLPHFGVGMYGWVIVRDR